MTDEVEPAIAFALLKRVETLPFSPSYPIAFPDKEFKDKPVPEPGKKWLRATLLRADTFGLGINANSANRHAGMLQVDLFAFPGLGEPALLRIGAVIRGHFALGTTLFRDGFRITVSKPPYCKQIMRDDPWQMLPVCIPYVCYAAN